MPLLTDTSSPQNISSLPGLGLHVLVLANFYPTPREPWFGVFVRDQVDDLRALGVDVEVLTFDGRSNRLEYVSAAHRLRRTIRRTRFDLVHAHYGLTGAVAATQLRVPVVTTFHGSDASERLERPVSWIAARRTQPIVVAANVAGNLGLHRAPVIPCAVDTERFIPRDRPAARRELGWRTDGTCVLFPAARRDPTKAMKRVDLFDATLAHVRRSIPDAWGASLDELDRDGVALAMAAADVTLLTSDREGAPVSVKESLASGTPVVSVPVGDVPSLLRGLPGCAITPRDPAWLAAGVENAVAASPGSELRDRVLGNGRAPTAALVIAVYRRLLDEQSGR